MYLNEVSEQILEILRDGYYSDGTAAPDLPYKVKEMEYEIATEENIDKTAVAVQTKPYALVSVGDPAAVPDAESDDQRTARETFTFEVILAVSDFRDELIQLKKAKELGWDVRRRLQGRILQTNAMAPSAVAFEAIEHIGTSTAITLYSVIFRVTGNVTVINA